MIKAKTLNNPIEQALKDELWLSFFILSNKAFPPYFILKPFYIFPKQPSLSKF